jgi:hypothetical protein
MRIKKNLSPKDGHYFKETDNSIHRANSWGGVIKKVTRYRALNHLPPGNPEQEVFSQACAREPTLCYHESRVTVEHRQTASLKGRVLAWLSHRMRNPGALAFTSDPAEPARRAQICATCPKNVALPEGCSSCRKVVVALRKEVLKGRAVDGRLNACAVIGQDNATSVHLDDVALPDHELPDHCWRKARTQ